VSALAVALLAFQQSAPDLHRDATNPHFGNKFLSMEGLMGKVLPVANGCGLVVTQFPTTVNGQGPKPALRTRITHAESGEFLEDVMLLMPGKDDPQGQGSAITYARRYSLMAALGLVADEDDDGNAAARSGAGSGRASTESSPAPDDYLAATEQAQRVGALPSEQIVHFGKNKGTPLSALTPAQLRWYATEWKVQDDPSDYDHRLKQAAIALHAGNDSPDFDLPFG
jgi:hypothetical protein